MENKILCENGLQLPVKGDPGSGKTLKVCRERRRGNELELDSWRLRDWSSFPAKLEAVHENFGERENCQGPLQQSHCDVRVAHSLYAVAALETSGKACNHFSAFWSWACTFLGGCEGVTR